MHQHTLNSGWNPLNGILTLFSTACPRLRSFISIGAFQRTSPVDFLSLPRCA